jgi:uncharacterized alpha/beta hydrolase family protein
MEKYIPYIVILLIVYLVLGFIKMQFNPQYWEQQTRGSFIIVVAGIMVIYRIFKLME